MKLLQVRSPGAARVSEPVAEPVAAARKRARILSVPFLAGAGLLALISLYFTLLQSEYNMYTYNLCLLAVLGALSLNLLMGTVGQASIGNAAFLAVGAFGTAFLDRAGVPMPADILIASLATGFVGLIVGIPALRIRGLYLVLGTLATYFIVIYVTTVYQSDTVGGSGFEVTVLFQSRGLLNGQRLWVWLLTVIVGVVLIGMRCIDHGRLGRAWRFIRDHEVAAPAVGISVYKYKLGAFWLSSVLLGFEGSLLAHFNGSVTTDAFPLALSISYVAMVLIGGLDSMLGAVIGAGLVTALPIVVPQLVTSLSTGDGSSSNGADLATIIYGLLIIFFMTRSPRGLAGWLETLARKVREGVRLRRHRVSPAAGDAAA
jgi:branched-chain amino acid transport system permease protein